MDEEAPSTASPFYALGRLQHALQTALVSPDPATRQRAAAKVARWQEVLEGMTSGALAVGSRTPVAGAPAWVTLEVVTGGFATGRFLADQPLDDGERKRLRELPPGPGTTERERLNLWYLGDDGQAELLAALAEERYRVDLPEHAGLPVVALLLEHGHPEAALDLVAALHPFLHRLRFTPQLTAEPRQGGTLVSLEVAGTVADNLRAASPRPQIVAMQEALRVWHPLFDELVALWAETVDGELPRLADHGTTVDGGWPARRFPADWAERRADWLARYEEAAGRSTAPGRHRQPKSNLSRLRAALELAGPRGEGLTARDVGWVRRALANTVTRHGEPGSERRAALRAVQAVVAARPTNADLAHVVAGRLDQLPPDEGLSSLDPITVETTAGEPIPESVVRKLERALEAPVEELVDRGIIGSGEVLARVLPQLTGRYVAAGLHDPVAAGLLARTYAAFRRRRSLLLLDLEHQVRFEELPWVAALDRFRGLDGTGDVPVTAARTALRDTVLLALTAFPERILPNPLVRELGALAGQAQLRLPLVEEVAADIFTGTFTSKWRSAAVVAGEALQGTLYARYYDLPGPGEWPPLPAEAPPRDGGWLRRRSGKRTAEDFAALCASRAVEAGDPGRSWSVARNGAVLEQSQILTTHNLAVLTTGLELGGPLTERAPELADHVLTWVVRSMTRLPVQHHPALQAVKNVAYGWRQALFFLSLCPPPQQFAALQRLVDATVSGPAARLRPAVDGLTHVLAGGRFTPWGTVVGGDGRRLLGWSVGEHWLLAN